MKIAPQIQFRGLRSTPALLALIHEQIEALERHCDDLVRCIVTVQLEQHRAHSGNPLRVAIRVTRPQAEIDVSHEAPQEDAYATIREAFAQAGRKLREDARVRHDVRRTS